MVHIADLFGLSALPTIGPAADLAFQESVRFPERRQSVRFDIHGVKIGQALQEPGAYAGGVARKPLQLVRYFAAHHDSPPPLHDEEHRADQRHVLAEVEDLW